jgi:hypothetical protein
MLPEVASYLDDVHSHLHLDPRTEKRVINELATHFQDKVDELRAQGLSEVEAARTALSSFGDARSIARLMYEAYSRGSWTEALISCQPHLIVAAIFATHIWRYPVLLGAAFAGIVLITIMGWRNGTPTWTYSWAGYAVLPLLIVSYLGIDPIARTVSFVLSGVGTPAPLWNLALFVVLFAFTLWLVVSTAVSIVRKDWILLTVVLLPLPVLVAWLATVSQSAGLLQQVLNSLEARLIRWDQAMAWFFTILGVTSALFVRVPQRAFKIGAVVAVGIVGGSVAARSLWGSLGVFHSVVVFGALFIILLVPYLLTRMVGHEHDAREILPS